MQYMLLIYGDEQGWGSRSDEERNAVFGDYLAFTTAIRESRSFVDVAPLQPTSTATSVRGRDGEQLVTDGPFAETKEQLGSCYRLSRKERVTPGGFSGNRPWRVGGSSSRPPTERPQRKASQGPESPSR
jgi:hypothetical protein